MKKVYLKLVAVAFIWGATWIAGKIAAPYLTPLTASAIRFCFASLCFVWAISRMRLWILPSINTLITIAFTGLIGIVAYNLCFFEGLKHITASRAALVIATNPICSMIGAHFFFKEKLNSKSYLGIFLSLCGALLVITQGDIEILWKGGLGIGELTIFGCVISWVIFTLLGKKLMGALSPMVASAYASMFGGAVLIFFAVGHGGLNELPAVPTTAWLALAFNGILGAFVAYKWYLDGVNALGPAKAALFTNLVPVFAVLLGIGLLGESLNIATCIGGGLVIGGIILTLYFKNKTVLAT